MKQKAYGFTIVELLIVIVVVAILASITIVAYNGVQQRANNTAIINAASQSLRMIQAYVAANGTYPATSNGCITTTTGCDTGSPMGTNTTFDTNMSSIGMLPRSSPTVGSMHYGVAYVYHAARTMNGASQPAALWYWLLGLNQQCNVSGVSNSHTDTAFSSTTGYTYGSDDATMSKTLCIIWIPGPSA